MDKCPNCGETKGLQTYSFPQGFKNIKLCPKCADSVSYVHTGKRESEKWKLKK